MAAGAGFLALKDPLAHCILDSPLRSRFLPKRKYWYSGPQEEKNQPSTLPDESPPADSILFRNSKIELNSDTFPDV